MATAGYESERSIDRKVSANFTHTHTKIDEVYDCMCCDPAKSLFRHSSKKDPSLNEAVVNK